MRTTGTQKGFFLAIALVLLMSSSHASQEKIQATFSPVSISPQENPSSGYAEKVIGELLHDIRVPGQVSDIMSTLYTKHRSEIVRIINGNPQVVWSTVELVFEALPALRNIRENDGAVIVDKEVYSKAEGVLDQYRSLASCGLAKDLDGLKRYVESRALPMDSGKIKVDLN